VEVSTELSYKFSPPFMKALEEIFIRKNSYKFSIILSGRLVGVIVLEKPNKNKTIYEVGYFVDRK